MKHMLQITMSVGQILLWSKGCTTVYLMMALQGRDKGKVGEVRASKQRSEDPCLYASCSYSRQMLDINSSFGDMCS